MYKTAMDYTLEKVAFFGTARAALNAFLNKIKPYTQKLYYPVTKYKEFEKAYPKTTTALKGGLAIGLGVSSGNSAYKTLNDVNNIENT